MLPNPDKYWLQRWYALRHSICATMNNIEDAEKPFKSLLGNLLSFGANQFYYFYLGFGGEKPKGDISGQCDNEEYEYQSSKKCGGKPQELVKDYAYPPEHVLRVVLDQIAYDFEVIQRALSHRQNKQTPDWKSTLCIADAWGQELLMKVTSDSGLLAVAPTVISYFNRTSRIRMIPYGDVALVGIPLTTTVTNQRRDLLVLSHELGHYVYWHGQIGGYLVRDRLKDIVQGELPFFRNWIEEIFADVFGIIVSGQIAMVPWAISMIGDNPPTLVVQDNHVHPIDAVRPYIYTHTLEAISMHILPEPKKRSPEEVKQAQQFATIWPGLNSIIRNSNANSGGFKTFKFVNRHGDVEAIALDALTAELRHIVDEIIKKIILPTIGNFNEWGKRLEGIAESLNYTLYNEHSPLAKYFEVPISLLLMTSGPEARPSTKDTFPNRPITTILQLEEILEGIPSINWTQLLTQMRLDEEINQKSYERFEIYLQDKFGSNCLSDDQEEGQNNESVYASEDRSFKKIRDTYFGHPLDPNIWKIVFAADGWTVKGPETWPTGGWEGDWSQDNFH